MFEVYRFRVRWAVSGGEDPRAAKYFEVNEEVPLDQLQSFRGGPRALLKRVRRNIDVQATEVLVESGDLYRPHSFRPRQVCRADSRGGLLSDWKDDGDWLDEEADQPDSVNLGYAALYAGAMVQHEAEKRRDREQYGIPADDPAYADLGTVGAEAFEAGKRILQEEERRRRSGGGGIL